MSLLELENVVTAYGKVEALKGLTLHVEQGEIVASSAQTAQGRARLSAPFPD
jgi:ABC-type branched-subunit amino acid transport system ATPase component